MIPSCSQSDIEDGISESVTPVEKTTTSKSTIIVTLKAAFSQSYNITNHTWITSSQVCANVGGDYPAYLSFGAMEINYTIKNVDFWTVERSGWEWSTSISRGDATASIERIHSGDNYSEFMPIMSTSESYIDENTLFISFNYPSDKDLYNIVWKSEGLDIRKPYPTPPPSVKPTVTISLKWNGSSWDVVADRPVASTLTILFEDPSTGGDLYCTLYSGQVSVTTNFTNPDLSTNACWIGPADDATYNYRPAN